MEETNEAVVQTKKSKKPLIITLCTVGVLLAAYLGLCAYAANLTTIFPGVAVYDKEVGGMTLAQAEAYLGENGELAPGTPINGLGIVSPEDGTLVHSEALIGGLTFADLGGVRIDEAASAQKAYDYCHGGGFFQGGWRFLQGLFGKALTPVLTAPRLSEEIASLTERISMPPVDTSYELDERGLSVTVSKDGFTLSAADLEAAVKTALADYAYASFDCPGAFLPAKTLSAQEIYDDVSGEVKNAGYDVKTKSITPEQTGAEFDVSAAQAILDAAAPGETVLIPADVQFPAVTAEELEKVLFRDVLGESRTHVSGTAARISNVKLASAAFNGTVLNSGDVFSYNAATGERTVAKGYQAAPAYVQGETVDEIGGGVCQPSSTLYLACLLANMEITERYAHRYAPTYIDWGMDATVSWGGPDYKFTNNTDYPIQIVATYAKGYLTVQLLGTKTDDVRVKMTNDVLSDTPWETVYEEDPTLAPGTEQVKTTPYTGHKVKTYRNLYDADGNLISSTFEAGSNYKSRNKVVLKGPAVDPATPATPATPADGPADIPAETVPPTEAPEVPAEPNLPETPPAQTPEEPVFTEQEPIPEE